MIKLHLPFVNLPIEFVALLKANHNVTNSSALILDIIRPNKALVFILETAFKDFDSARGLEKVINVLGWANFRERMASIYIYKSLYGDFPSKTDMELVDDLKFYESRYTDHSVNSFSRLFLLGFYLKLANLEIQHGEDNKFPEIKLPADLGDFLRLSEGRSERIDWLILILLHLKSAFGDKQLMKYLMDGKKFDDIYLLMSKEDQATMGNNLMAYGASIQESEVFLYEKV